VHPAPTLAFHIWWEREREEEEEKKKRILGTSIDVREIE
jgi:hypothetical protein